MIKCDHLNYLRFKLLKDKNANNIANPHEQEVITIFPR
jgi:hypothetical protein